MTAAPRLLPDATSTAAYRAEVHLALTMARRARRNGRADVAAAEIQFASFVVGELARERSRLGATTGDLVVLAWAVLDAERELVSRARGRA